MLYYLPILKASLFRKFCVNASLLVPHICVSAGSDNGKSSIRHQAITWTNAGLLWNGPLGTNFSEILMKTQKMYLEISSAKWQPFVPGRTYTAVNKEIWYLPTNLKTCLETHLKSHGFWQGVYFNNRVVELNWTEVPAYMGVQVVKKPS